MTRGECISRLFGAYNKNATPGMLYYYEEWAKGLSVEMVSSIVDAVVKENTYLPTVNKLYEVSKERLGHKTDDMLDEDCFFCDSTGLIPGIYKDAQGVWFHAVISSCKCSKGKRMASDAIPQREFKYDTRYIDLMKHSKEVEGIKVSPWGCIPYFYEYLRGKSINATPVKKG